MNLTPGTRYEALVCLPRFNISTAALPPESNTTFISECGFCSVCFRTDDLVFEFMLTECSRVNESHVNLTCQIESNLDFFIEWSVGIIDPETDEPRRMKLVDGELFYMEPVSIYENSIEIEGGMEIIVTSELIVSDSIFQMDVECTARSVFGAESSAAGTFEEGS